MNHRITTRRDGRGHWLVITDTRTGRIVRETWGSGTRRAAEIEAEQIVERIEWAETVAALMTEAA